ncbi:ABC-2 type transport system permease protein [Thermocatellispora tengchongensis]|uniref:ABC-2 type transport system permease protein n=1 Tax=Thermocatellispora tengchongensis TaxID=1073253 RepID=A0A840PKB3_9ACTN|nr:hypothetical protein [Thermocatellispora tengchongensis]MBB5137507.1 ABC-2 type transport system permease protein [Thermocatellispora tengchongensis]
MAATTATVSGGAHAPARQHTGALTLLLFILGRDKVRFAIWILLLVAIPIFNAFSLEALLPTPESREVFAQGNEANPVTLSVLGPVVDTSMQGIVAWRSAAQGVLVAGLASALMVIRHTRTEEESGRRELISATAVGRQAGLTAAFAAVFAANLVSGLALTLLLVLVTGYPLAGSLLYGLLFALIGCAYGAAAGTVAQLAQSSALGRGICVGLLAAAFAPGIGGARGESEWLAWLSPIGWTRFARVYVDEQWWVALVPIALTVAFAALAYALSARRDLGSGTIPDRAGTFGPPQAGPRLRSPLALAWRLHHDHLLTWTLSLTVVSILVGWVSNTFDDRLGGLGVLREWLAGLDSDSVGDAFLAIITFVLLLVVGVPAVSIPLRAHAEEEKAFAATLLAGPVSRSRWLSGHVLFALAGPSLMLLLVGLGTGVPYALATGQPEKLTHQVGQALLGLPAVWFIAAVTLALYGLVPRAAVAVGWGFLVVLLILVAVGEAGLIGRGAFVFTPFGYSHPMMTLNWAAPIAFTVLAAVLVAAAYAGFRRRDLEA